MTEWARVEPILPGLHGATVLNIRLALGASSGKPMYVWEFRLDSGPLVKVFNSTRGKGAAFNFRIVKALGLSQEFSVAEAAGRSCRLDIKINKAGFPEVSRVLAA